MKLRQSGTETKAYDRRTAGDWTGTPRRRFPKNVGRFAAGLGGTLDVPFTRPRERAAVIEHADDYPLSARLIPFLEDEAQPKASAQDAA